MRIAAIDIGSYSVRLTVAEIDGEDIRIILEKGRITSLGSGLKEEGKLRKDRIEETLEVLKEYRKDIEELKVQKVLAVATEAIRRASNSEEVLKLVRERAGFEVKVITPYEEGELAFLGASYALRPKGKVLVIDQGGGSTEFIFGKDFRVEEITSLPLGIVNLTESFLKHDPPKGEEIKSLMYFLEDHIKPLKRDVEEIIGLGGTITTLVALEYDIYPYDPKKVQGKQISIDALERWFDKLSAIPSKERSGLYKQIEDRRAEVILAGIAMFIKILEIFEKDKLRVSDWGVKQGLIVRELLRIIDTKR